MIESVGLTKNYGNKLAVNRVSFNVKPGECFGILGPNGAGKTSTFKMIYGSSNITEGELFLDGLSVKSHTKKVKSLLGVVPQDNGLDPDFTVMDNLLIFASYYGVSRADALVKSKELLRRMHLEDTENSPVDELSGGMKRRLAIARALITDPKIILLDEPTTGLDPQARLWIGNELQELKKQGKTLVLTTHYMEEAETLCDRIIIMNKGEVVAEGKPNDLIKSHVGSEVVEFEVAGGDLQYHIEQIRGRFPYQVNRNRLQIHLQESKDSKDLISQITSEQILVRKASLNDVFLKIAGYEITD